jgi:DNA polymerase I-like protein with 3'-5' exonuclease and polymerase domains
MLTQVRKLPRLEGREVVVDIEASGLDYMRDTPFLLGVRTLDDCRNYCIHWNGPDVTEWLTRELPTTKKVIGHNLKYDFHMMAQGNVPINALMETDPHDTMLVEVLLDENQVSFALDSLAKFWLGKGKDTNELYEYLASLYGGNPDKTQMKKFGKFAADFHQHPTTHAPHVVPYLIGDLERTGELYAKRTPLLLSNELDIVYDLEMEVLKSLLFMERTGIPIDEEALDRAIDEFSRLYSMSQLKTTSFTGFSTNVMSSPSLIMAFHALGIEVPYSDGRVSFKRELLEAIDHPFAQQVLYERGIRKANEAFGKGFKPYIYPDGRIHTNFNQMRGDEYGTVTGRLSSSGPNMQQIPKRNAEMAKHLRSVFVAPPGYKWINADWSQFEFRVFAHYTNDTELLQAYINDPDIDYHQALTDILNKEFLARDRVKRINLGLVFGMGEGKLAKECKLPYTEKVFKDGKKGLVAGDEAKAIFAEYHERFPGAKRVLTRATALARARGFVRTISGRRIRFPKPQFTYKAGGSVFQGTSADIMKAKTNEFIRAFRKTDTRLILVVHDEFNLIAKENEAENVAEFVRETLQTVPSLRIPIRAKVGIGKNWYEAGENQT